MSRKIHFKKNFNYLNELSINDLALCEANRFYIFLRFNITVLKDSDL